MSEVLTVRPRSADDWSVLSGVALTSVEQVVTDSITNPDVCRCVNVTCTQAGNTSPVQIIGIGWDGKPATETINLTGIAHSGAAGVVPFREVIAVVLPPLTTASDEVSVGCEGAIGFPLQMVTVDALETRGDGADGWTAQGDVGSTDPANNTVSPGIEAGWQYRWTYTADYTVESYVMPSDALASIAADIETISSDCDSVASDIEAIAAKTDLIGSLEITVTSPIDTAGDIEVQQGQDLAADLGTQIDFDITSGAITSKDWTSATATLYFSDNAGLVGAISSIDGGKRLRFTATAAVTELWDAGVYDYKAEVVFADGEKYPIRGSITVLEDI